MAVGAARAGTTAAARATSVAKRILCGIKLSEKIVQYVQKGKILSMTGQKHVIRG